jgi:hypothetical protein
MVHALPRVASRGGPRSVARLARSFTVAGLLNRGRNVGRWSFAVAGFFADPHRHFDPNRDFDANRNRDFDAHWHSDGDFDRHVDALDDRDRLGGFATAALSHRGRGRWGVFGFATATFAAVAAAKRAAEAWSVAPTAAVAAAVAAKAAVAPAVMAPTVVTEAAAEVVAITAVVTEAAMSSAVSPSRSLGGRESCDGECGEGGESEDGGTDFHGNLLWVDVRGSRVDRFEGSVPSMPSHHRGFDGFFARAFLSRAVKGKSPSEKSLGL